MSDEVRESIFTEPLETFEQVAEARRKVMLKLACNQFSPEVASLLGSLLNDAAHHIKAYGPGSGTHDCCFDRPFPRGEPVYGSLNQTKKALDAELGGM